VPDTGLPALAFVSVLDVIGDLIDDRMGLGELLDDRDAFDGLSEAEQDALCERLAGEIRSIRDRVAAHAPGPPPGGFRGWCEPTPEITYTCRGQAGCCGRATTVPRVPDGAGATDDQMRAQGWRIGHQDRADGRDRVEICPACADQDPGYWARLIEEQLAEVGLDPTGYVDAGLAGHLTVPPAITGAAAVAVADRDRLRAEQDADLAANHARPNWVLGDTREESTDA